MNTMKLLRHWYREIWILDTEYHAPDGERPAPICLVAVEYFTGRTIHIWQDEFRRGQSPIPTGPDALFVAWYAPAELSCYLALDWSMPERVLDLYVEFSNHTNGRHRPCGRGLLGAAAYFGFSTIGTSEKTEMRGLAIRGGPFSGAEREALLTYCESDVRTTTKIFEALLPGLDWPRALIRGRYAAAVAKMERVGTPIDTETLKRLRAHWPEIKGRLIREVDKDFGVFVPTDLSPVSPAILEAAQENHVDPLVLREVVKIVQEEEEHNTQPNGRALKAARARTGLDRRRIERWEAAGMDYASWPGLDVAAQELAGDFPELFNGPVLDFDGYDGIDRAGALWDRLREGVQRPTPRYGPEILEEALRRTNGTQLADLWPASASWSFSAARFDQWLALEGIPWPRLPSGALDLSDDAFRDQSRTHPAVAPLRELRHILGQLRLEKLSVGSDDRNRCLLSPFASKTSRNQPSNARFVFGPSVWIRSLIRPEPGRGLAYCDWSQQEFGIAAALSGDPAMLDAYGSGDPYLAFAQQAGAAPPGATKATHGPARERFKVCALAVQYGMESKSLSIRLGAPEVEAQELLRLHRETYPRFWAWTQAIQDRAMLGFPLQTVFGWTLHPDLGVKPRTAMNYPVQGNGAEMLRLACCLATEAGVVVNCPVHDALLVEAPIAEIETTAGTVQRAMAAASKIVLAGFELRTDVEVIRYPARYSDRRGTRMWELVTRLLEEVERDAETAVPQLDPVPF